MKLAHHLPLTPYPYRGEPAPCPLCGGASATTVARLDRRLKRLTTLCCDGCGLVRTDPMPTEAELDAYYGGEYRQDYQLAVGRPSARHIGVSRREAALRLALLGEGLKPGAQVVDFGSGSGEFVKAASDAGFRARGIEPGLAFAAFSRREYGAEILSPAEAQAAIAPGSLDLITAHHVIEHLRDPVAQLARFAAWLKPDGLVYIAVPDVTHPGKPTFERFHFAHLYNFSPETLEAAAAKAGLEPDPRFPRREAVRVFRRAPDRAASWAPPAGAAARVRGALPHVSVRRHVLTGAWLVPMLKRAAKWRRQRKLATAT